LHPEHLQGRRGALTPQHETPDDVADAERHHEQRDGEEVRPDPPAGRRDLDTGRELHTGCGVALRGVAGRRRRRGGLRVTGRWRRWVLGRRLLVAGRRLLVARWRWLVARWRLLVARWRWLVARWRWLVARRWLLATRRGVELIAAVGHRAPSSRSRRRY